MASASNQPTESTDAEMYATILGSLDAPIAKYLCEVHSGPTPLNDSGATSSTVSVGALTLGTTNTPITSPDSLIFRDDWHGAVSRRNAVTEKWDIYPPSDITIYTIVQNAEECVSLLINNMRNLDDKVEDNPGAKDRDLIANKVTTERFEVTARLILVRLLERCITGYTGLVKGEPRKEDRVSCIDRFKSVAYVLERWKAVCRDVLQEDSKIVEFVHQPITIMRQKQAHKATNNKRANAVDGPFGGDIPSTSIPNIPHGEISRQNASGHNYPHGLRSALSNPVPHNFAGFQRDRNLDEQGPGHASVDRTSLTGSGGSLAAPDAQDRPKMGGSALPTLPKSVLQGIGGGRRLSEFNRNREDIERRAQRSLTSIGRHGFNADNPALPPPKDPTSLTESSETNDPEPEEYNSSPSLSRRIQPPSTGSHPS